MSTRFLMTLLVGFVLIALLGWTLWSFLSDADESSLSQDVNVEASEAISEGETKRANIARSSRQDEAVNQAVESTVAKRRRAGFVLVRVKNNRGEAIPDAFVELVNSRLPFHLSDPLDQGFTNEAGEIRLESLPKSLLLIVNRDRSSRKHLSESSERVALIAGEEKTLKIELEPCTSKLIVRTVVQDGTPVVGGIIRLRNLRLDENFRGQTNKNGEAIFNKLPRGNYRVDSSFKHAKPKAKSAPTEFVELEDDQVVAVNQVVTKQAEICLKLQFEGPKLLEDLIVEVNLRSDSGPWKERRVTCRLLEKKELTVHVLPGRVKIKATAVLGVQPLVCWPIEEFVEVGEGQKVECRLKVFTKGNNLICTVVDDRGEPLSRIRVTGKFFADDPSSLSAIVDGTTNGKGVVEFPALPDGQIELSATGFWRSHEQGRAAFANIGTSGTETQLVSTKAVRARLELTRAITVRVKFAKPTLAGERVEIKPHPLSQMPLAQGLLQLDFTGLAPGNYILVHKSPNGEILARKALDLVARNEEKTTIEVRLQ